MRILTVAPDQYERHLDDLRQMHLLRATVFGGRLAWDVSITAEKSATSTTIASRLIFWQLPMMDWLQVAFVFFQLLARRCWSRPSPSFSIRVRFALIRALSRVRAFASTRPGLR